MSSFSNVFPWMRLYPWLAYRGQRGRTGLETYCDLDEIIVFNQVVRNFGGHYSPDTMAARLFVRLMVFAW